MIIITEKKREEDNYFDDYSAIEQLLIHVFSDVFFVLRCY